MSKLTPTVLAQASAGATELAAVTEELNGLLAEVESRLNRMGFGVTTAVRCCGDDSLAYMKSADKWGLFVVESGSQRAVPLLSSSRAHRVYAASILDELVAQIAENVVAQVSDVRGALDVIRKVLELL